MTERECLDALWGYYNGTCELAVPHTNVLGWEADLLVITAAKLTTVVEVKTSVSDFRADFRGKPGSNKADRIRAMTTSYSGAPDDPIVAADSWPRQEWPASLLPLSVVEPHMSRTAKGETRFRFPQGARLFAAPHRFVYAYPVDLAEKLDEQVPHWAGIVHITHTRYSGGVIRLTAGPARSAPQLHKSPFVTDAARARLHAVMHHRIWGERQKTAAALRSP